MNVGEWPRFHYAGTVERVIDGDTCQILLDLGDRTYRARRIRILGYDAPELFSGDDREAGAAAKEALAVVIPAGTRVYIKTLLDRTSFDRLLGTVYVEGADGYLYDVADAMIDRKTIVAS